MLDITAHPHHMSEWGPGNKRSRFDYDSPDHLFDEIQQMGAEYFGRFFWNVLRAGDIVYLTDAAGKRVTLIINHVDQIRRKVDYDVDVVHAEQIVMAADEAYTVRWRGPRGGRWCVVDRNNEVVSRDNASKEEAERRLRNLTEAQAAA